jgi:hypothetical protein
LVQAVWSHNTSVSRASNFTPFKLLFDEEAVTPEEIKFKSARTMLDIVHSPKEVESKDLLESDKLRMVDIPKKHALVHRYRRQHAFAFMEC